MKALAFVRDEFARALEVYRVRRGTALALLAFPVVLVPAFGWFLALRDTHAFTYMLLMENGVVEIATFASFVAAAVAAVLLAVRVARGGGPRAAVRFYAGLALVAFTGGMEEISWGQAFLDFDTPWGLYHVNEQGELNIHNLPGLMELNPMLLLAFGLVLSGALWMSYRPRLRAFGAPTLAATHAAVILVTGAMCYLVYVFYFGETFDLLIGMLSEVVELLMGVSLLLYAILNARAAAHLGLVRDGADSAAAGRTRRTT